MSRNEELRDAYREVVLTLAGVLSVYEADDALVWAVARSLGQVIDRRLRRAPPAGPGPRPARHRPHPAVVQLLATLDGGAAEARP